MTGPVYLTRRDICCRTPAPCSSRRSPARGGSRGARCGRSRGRRRRSGGTRRSCRASSSTSSVRLTCTGSGFLSSLPKMPSSGAVSFSVRSIGATGFLASRSFLSLTMTLPPQQSTTASRPEMVQAARYDCRPPEQKPITPTLPFEFGCARRIRHRALDVAHHLIVGHAAGGAHAGADVIGAAGTVAEVEVRRDRREAVMRELARDLDDPLVPARQMMNHHHAAEPSRRAKAARNRPRPCPRCDPETKPAPTVDLDTTSFSVRPVIDAQVRATISWACRPRNACDGGLCPESAWSFRDERFQEPGVQGRDQRALCRAATPASDRHPAFHAQRHRSRALAALLRGRGRRMLLAAERQHRVHALRR